LEIDEKIVYFGCIRSICDLSSFKEEETTANTSFPKWIGRLSMHSQGKAADLYRYWQIYIIVYYLRKPANPHMLQTCLSSLPHSVYFLYSIPRLPELKLSHRSRGAIR